MYRTWVIYILLLITRQGYTAGMYGRSIINTGYSSRRPPHREHQEIQALSGLSLLAYLCLEPWSSWPVVAIGLV